MGVGLFDLAQSVPWLYFALNTLPGTVCAANLSYSI